MTRRKFLVTAAAGRARGRAALSISFALIGVVVGELLGGASLRWARAIRPT